MQKQTTFVQKHVPIVPKHAAIAQKQPAIEQKHVPTTPICRAMLHIFTINRQKWFTFPQQRISHVNFTLNEP
jgi:hypothetical protein